MRLIAIILVLLAAIFGVLTSRVAGKSFRESVLTLLPENSRNCLSSSFHRIILSELFSLYHEVRLKKPFLRGEDG